MEVFKSKIIIIIIQVGLFYWSALKMTKYQPHRIFWHLKLFRWDLLCNLTLRHFLGQTSQKNTLYKPQKFPICELGVLLLGKLLLHKVFKSNNFVLPPHKILNFSADDNFYEKKQFTRVGLGWSCNLVFFFRTKETQYSYCSTSTHKSVH